MPKSNFLFQTLLTLYYQDNRTNDLVALARDWLDRNPGDRTATEVLQQFGTQVK